LDAARGQLVVLRRWCVVQAGRGNELLGPLRVARRRGRAIGERAGSAGVNDHRLRGFARSRTARPTLLYAPAPCCGALSAVASARTLARGSRSSGATPTTKGRRPRAAPSFPCVRHRRSEGRGKEPDTKPERL